MDVAEQNKQTVRRFLQAVEAGDLATVEELQAPECTWWVVGRGNVSREAYIADVRSMLLTADERHVEFIRLLAEGESVAAEIRSAFHFGERIYRNEYHDLFVLKDGKIVHGREYFDTNKVTAFFGAMEN
jgi:uncharacterized protein